MLLGKEQVLTLTLDSTVEEVRALRVPKIHVLFDRVPKYVHLLKLGLITDDELCERLYLCYVGAKRNAAQIDAIYDSVFGG